MASFVVPLHPPQPNPILHHRLRITPRASQSPPPPPPFLLDNEEETQTSQTTTTLGRGCKACGRVEVERGCNGEGRIQGGIATVPGFGWWPIKAYRPCPGFVESGGSYRRRGQSMDEVAFGRGQREAPPQTTDDNDDAETKKTKPGSRRLKG